jgi:CRP-like cAMP-binding protein
VGEYFFILKEGSVRYYADYKPKGSDALGSGKVIGMANKPGQSFGELCLLYDCPPPADCVSGDEGEAELPCKDGACVLWRIHRDTFRKILALRTMRRDKKLREALEKVPCFMELDTEYLKRIGDALNPRNVEKGGVLFREGDEADTLYLIGTEGKVQLTRADGRQQLLGPYQSFGDESISYNLSGEAGGDMKKGSNNGDSPPRRRETALALERTVILSMSANQFSRVVGSLEDAILLSRDRRLLKSVPLFRDSDIEDFEYELLTALIETTHARQDKEIFVEGDNIDEPALYIVRSGEVEIISEAYPKLNRVVRPGEFFGEDTVSTD